MFKLPKEVISGIIDYKSSLKRLISGEISAARFKGVRVPWGVYSQRKNEGNMARVRFPAGTATGAQLKAMAQAAKDFSDGILHVTDRQDIQIHNLSIENTGGLMDYLIEYGLSPRGGGGNTVRNITSCPLSGICEDEVFDVRSCAVRLTEYMLADDASYTLPRKYKISFSGCGIDCAYATVNDLGFIAKMKNNTPGYAVYVGGGLGASSRVSELFEKFIALDEVPYVAEAVKRVFSTHGDRRDKHHARLRFLIEKIGLEKFRKLYAVELEKLKGQGEIKLRDVVFEYPTTVGGKISGGADDKQFSLFKRHNVSEQVQKGYYAVEVRLRLGDIGSDDLDRLGSLEDDFPGIEFRTTQRQNIIIANVSGSDVYALYKKLKDYSLALPYASTALDFVCCAGASTCNLGICDSKAMSFELIRMLEESLDSDKLENIGNIKVNINGCSNSCGHAPIGFIGLTGTTKRLDSRMTPFYKISLGGRIEEGKSRLNEEVGLVSARNTPKVMVEFLSKAADKIGEYDDPYEYLEKEGIMQLQAIIKEHSHVPLYAEDASFYRDWDKTEDFTLAGIGSAECGAGVMEIIESDLADAEASIAASDSALDATSIKDALHYGARALLVVKGIDPRNPKETFDGFVKEIIKPGFADPKFKTIRQAYDSLGDGSAEPDKRAKLVLAQELLADVSQTFKLMDNSFNFKKRY